MLRDEDKDLLRAIRLLSQLRMYAGLHIVTSEHVKRAQNILRQFAALLEVRL